MAHTELDQSAVQGPTVSYLDYKETGPDRSGLQDLFDPIQRTVLHQTGNIPVVVDFPKEGEPNTVVRNITYIDPDGVSQGREYEVRFHDASSIGGALSMESDPQGHLVRLTGADVVGATDYMMKDRIYRVLHLNMERDRNGHSRSFQTPGESHTDRFTDQPRRAFGYHLPRRDF